MNKLTQDAEAIRHVKTELALRGWRHEDLAKKTGLSKGTVSNVLAGTNTFWPPRAAINAALGMEIFTPPQTKPFPVSDRMIRPGQTFTKTRKRKI